VTPEDSTNAGASIVLAAGTHTVESVPHYKHLLGVSGVIDCNANTLTTAKIETTGLLGADIIRKPLYDLSSGTYFVSPLGGYAEISLTVNSALEINDVSPLPTRTALRLMLVINQDATGGWTLTIPAYMTPHKGAQTIPTGANSVTVINMISNNGADWIYWVEP